MAKGSRRRLPTAPAAAAVVSDAMIEPRNTPCSQSKDWSTSGTTDARRPPKRIAEIGHARGVLPLRGDRRVLGGRGGETGVRVGGRGALLGRPVLTPPVGAVGRADRPCPPTRRRRRR